MNSKNNEEKCTLNGNVYAVLSFEKFFENERKREPHITTT